MKRVVWDQSTRICEWVGRLTGAAFSTVNATAIGLERDGVLIAGAVFDAYLGRSIQMHIASTGRLWASPRFLSACARYAFLQLGVEKVIAPIDSTNEATIKFVVNAGFVLDAFIDGAGRKGDLLFYTMTRQECRFLGDRYGR